MIDFSSNSVWAKLKPVDGNEFSSIITPVFTQGEQVIAAFKGIRDGVVFTNKRIITINVQGITGKKKDITSLPYSKIQAFSVETAGVIDWDSELEIWFSGLGKVKFEFLGRENTMLGHHKIADMSDICRIISEYVL